MTSGRAATQRLSPRLREIVDALPMRPGMRVLEVSCGPGAALREVARNIGDSNATGIDRSPQAITQASAACKEETAAGVLAYHCVAVENLESLPGEAPFDLALTVRVGALDGRHPEI